MLYETILNFEDNNLDNLKLIYRFIGDTDFTFYKKVLEGMECVSNRIDFDALSLTPIKNIESVEPTWNLDDSKEDEDEYHENNRIMQGKKKTK